VQRLVRELQVHNYSAECCDFCRRRSRHYTGNYGGWSNVATRSWRRALFTVGRSPTLTGCCARPHLVVTKQVAYTRSTANDFVARFRRLIIAVCKVIYMLNSSLSQRLRVDYQSHRNTP